MFLFGRIRLTKCLYSGNKDAMTFILGALFFLLTFPCAVQVVYCLRFSSVKTDSCGKGLLGQVGEMTQALYAPYE
jgi:hypothetical protein